MSTLIYNFGDNTADGGAELKHLLGGKGANLGEMSRLGLACASRIYHHHRGLLELLCQQWFMGRWSCRKHQLLDGTPRRTHRSTVWFSNQPVTRIRTFWCSCFNARV